MKMEEKEAPLVFFPVNSLNSPLSSPFRLCQLAPRIDKLQEGE